MLDQLIDSTPAPVIVRECDMPDAPDNLREWEQLPETFREAVADRFESGIANEWALQCERTDRLQRSQKMREARRTGGKKAA